MRAVACFAGQVVRDRLTGYDVESATIRPRADARKPSLAISAASFVRRHTHSASISASVVAILKWPKSSMFVTFGVGPR